MSREIEQATLPPPAPSHDSQHELWQEFTRKLATALGEHDDRVIQQIKHFVRRLGSAACVELLGQALAIQRHGGEIIRDGSRQRTLGGLWFRLAKERIKEG